MSDAPARSRPDPRLVTPEAVVLDLPLAGIGSRGVAFAIDAVVMGVGLVALAMSAGFLDDAFTVLPGWVGVTVVLLSITTLIFGYPIAFETLWGGRTPGKAAMGLRVVTTEGGPIRFRHAATRAILSIVDFHITGGAAALFTAFSNARSQRLGDIVAGTVVVRERSGAVAPTATEFGVPPGLEAVARSIDVSGVDATQYQALRTLLRRAPTLTPSTRDRLASDLVGRIHPAARAAVPEGVPPLAALQLVAAAVQARGRGPAPGRPRGSDHSGPSSATTPTVSPGLARPLDVWSPDPAASAVRRDPAPTADGVVEPAGTNGFTPPA